MNWCRHTNDISATSLAEHGKPNGSRLSKFAEQIPKLGLLDGFVPGSPHFDLMGVTPVEAVGHDTMLIWKAATEQVALHGPSDTGKTWYEFYLLTTFCHALEIGHGRHVGGPQTWYREIKERATHVE
jgi:hypothetical protein